MDFNIAGIDVQCTDRGEEKDNGNIINVTVTSELSPSAHSLLKAIPQILHREYRADFTFIANGVAISDNVPPREYARDDKQLVSFQGVCEVLGELAVELSEYNQGPALESKIANILRAERQRA